MSNLSTPDAKRGVFKDRQISTSNLHILISMYLSVDGPILMRFFQFKACFLAVSLRVSTLFKNDFWRVITGVSACVWVFKFLLLAFFKFYKLILKFLLPLAYLFLPIFIVPNEVDLFTLIHNNKEITSTYIK